LDESVAALRRAIELKPDHPEARNNLAVALWKQRRFDEAVAACRRALEIQPGDTDGLNTLGAILCDMGRLDEAIDAYRQAIALKPDFSAAHRNLGIALNERGQINEATAAYHRAIALAPDDPQAHFGLAVAWLAQGDFLRGWEKYEWRWQVEDADFGRHFTQPLWDGSPLEGRTLLLYDDQGIGDAIQFIRYLPLAAQRGENIILECQRELQRLFQTMASDFPLLARGQTLPDFDLYCPLSSLPRIFSTDASNIPGTAPYLRADTAGAALWRERLGPSTTLKVGLAWAGNPNHKNDRNRSLRLVSLAPLTGVPGVRFRLKVEGAGFFPFFIPAQ
jgi:hypothetical protein